MSNGRHARLFLCILTGKGGFGSWRRARDFYRAGLQGMLRVGAPDGRVCDESHGLVLNEIRDGESLGEGASQSLALQRDKVR